MRHFLLIAAALGATLGSTGATAARYAFNLTGSRTAAFTLQSTAPSFFSAFQTQFKNVPGSFGGLPGVASAVSFGVTPLISSLDVVNMTLGFSQFTGPQLFTGPTSSPVFTVGTFNLSGIVSGQSTLTISSVAGVPEPAAWLSLTCGFALVGSAVRRRARLVAA